MMPILQLGPLAVQVPGLVLLLSLWLGLTYAERHAARNGIHAEQMYNLVFTALVVGILGARLSFAAQHVDAFRANPAGLLSLSPGLLDPAGGIAAGLLAGLIYGQRKGLAFWPALDALTPLFAALLVGLALSNLASGKGFGAPTALPWALELWGERRHPTQIYELLAAGLILAALHPARFRPEAHPPGTLFLVFLAAGSAVKLFLEGFRGDSVTLDNGLRVAQIAAWFVLAAALWLLRGRRTNPIRSKQSPATQ